MCVHACRSVCARARTRSQTGFIQCRSLPPHRASAQQHITGTMESSSRSREEERGERREERGEGRGERGEGMWKIKEITMSKRETIGEEDDEDRM